MNIQPTTGRPFLARCYNCGRGALAGDMYWGETVYVSVRTDRDGASWRAYYCEKCAAYVRAGERREQATAPCNPELYDVDDMNTAEQTAREAIAQFEPLTDTEEKS